MRSALVLALALSFGCAPKRSVEPEVPVWQDRGRADQLRIELAEVLLEDGNADGALHIVAELRKDHCRRPEVELIHGRALHLQGLHSDAEARLLEARRRAPARPEPWRALGVLWLDMDRPADAERAFLEALARDDEHAATWNNLGFVQLGLGRPAEAVESLRRAVALDGAPARYKNNLGFALAASGSRALALEVFLGAAPPADAHVNLGAACELAGDLVCAGEAYGRALAIDPTHSSAKESMARLSGPAGVTP